MRVAVVIPCYKVKKHILGVIEKIGSEVCMIVAIDDGCPDGSGAFIKSNCRDPRVRVVSLPENRGVGGAVMAGYLEAMSAGADVMVKVDGDGQMDPGLLPLFISPIVSGNADYVKGNRFFDIDSVRAMPKVRLLGNAGLSMLSKLSSGYWDIFDPTNGYTALRAETCKFLPLEKISKRYFFESDMLFRLNLARAVVVDMPMDAVYEDEVSNLKISKIIYDFAFKHARNFVKRVFYSYFLRDMSIASFQLLTGVVLLLSGLAFGAWKWVDSAAGGYPATAGTVMLAALPVILGIQMLLAFVAYDISSVPKRSRFSGAEINK